jgi:radical SAM-linked protein
VGIALNPDYIALLEHIQNASRLIGGESGSGPGFTEQDRLRVALAFPEAYEIGISNQAVQILYHLARRLPGVGVERVYLPWVEAIALLRERRLPLVTLETWTPVREAHLLGITLQHELNYTNVLELLSLAGIPLRAVNRSGMPLVLAGGPAVANFLPMLPFFDAFVIGDGEEVFPEVLHSCIEGVEAAEDRRALLRRLAGITGVFVPGISVTAERRVIPRLEGAPYPADCLVPLAAGVHDRAWVEIMRGCTRGCRFCQAGMWYRPVRERRAESVLQMAGSQLVVTGHEELALSSLSTTDYTALRNVLTALGRDLPDVRVALPSLRVDSAAIRLNHLASPSGSTVTLAPEAGSQRLRDVINKNVSEADISGAAREAFACGYTVLKLYFMIGLPSEEDEDVQAIVDLCGRLRDLGRGCLGSRAARLSLHVSVTNFIPKPATPFQWEAMAERATLLRRQKMLRAGLGRSPFKLSLHSIDTSYLEAALARGGVDLADVIEEAWERGARFDCWTEQERLDAWGAAFAARGLSAEQLATATLDPEGELPWDIIQGPVVSREFLKRERDRAARGMTTGDCRWDACQACGVCGAAVTGPHLAAEHGDEVQSEPWVRGVADSAMESRAAVARDSGSGRFSYVLEFSVRGRQRFLAHLDTLQLLRRAVRRAGGRLALSSGLRPKPLLSVALPRPVGVESRQEFCQLTLSEPPPRDFAPRLAAALPDGVRVIRIAPWRRRASVPAEVTGCTYEVEVVIRDTGAREGVVADGVDVLRAAMRSYTEAGSIGVERRRPGEVRVIDVKAFVQNVEVSTPEPGADGGRSSVRIRFRTAVSPRGSARPQEVVEALQRVGGVDLLVRGIERLEIDIAGEGPFEGTGKTR